MAQVVKLVHECIIPRCILWLRNQQDFSDSKLFHFLYFSYGDRSTNMEIRLNFGSASDKLFLNSCFKV